MYSRTISIDNIASMDFQNVNSLNVWLNLLSGNLLPMGNRDTSFSFSWKIYSVFVWIFQSINATAMVFGCIYVPIEKILKDGISSLIVIMEMFIMFLRIRTRKHLMYQLIQKLNEVLQNADEMMKNVVTATLEPLRTPLNFYWSAGVVSLIIWTSAPFALIFKKNLFLYEDYRMPVALSKQPFSLGVFLMGSLFVMISAIYMFLKKVGVDVYMVHLVLMVTAQYKYIALKNAVMFGKENKGDKFQKKYSLGINRKKEEEIRALCQHHNNVVHITLLLKELLSLNFSILYMSNIFRFCFLIVMLSNATFSEAVSVGIYALGAIMQLYILCYCVQQLLEASTELTDKAFHEKWYLLEPSAKHIFILIIMANNLECKVATFENFNLTLPSFMTILNQSYSFALLFRRIK